VRHKRRGASRAAAVRDSCSPDRLQSLLRHLGERIRLEMRPPNFLTCLYVEGDRGVYEIPEGVERTDHLPRLLNLALQSWWNPGALKSLKMKVPRERHYLWKVAYAVIAGLIPE
jgi:hypothetical protein